MCITGDTEREARGELPPIIVRHIATVIQVLNIGINLLNVYSNRKPPELLVYQSKINNVMCIA